MAVQQAREAINRDKEEQEEKDKLAKELANIERERQLEDAREGQKLAQAKAQNRRQQVDEKSKAGTAPLESMPVSNATSETEDTDFPATKDSAQTTTRTKPGPASIAPTLPDGFLYHYFAS